MARYAAATGLLVAAVQPAIAQDGGDDGGGGLLDGLGDIIIGALTELLRILFSPIRSVIEDHGDALLDLVVGTPHPDSVSARRPTARGQTSTATTGRRSSRCRSACTGWPSGW